MEDVGISPLSDGEIEQEIEKLQLDLRRYVLSINGSMVDDEEVIQQTNIFVWERRLTFEAGTSFKSWAFSVARYKLKGLRRDAMRRGHVVFCEETVDLIADRAEQRFTDDTDRISYLRDCVMHLKKKDQHLILEFYMKGNSLTDYAARVGKSVSAVHKMVSRIRLKLRDCVHKKIKNYDETIS